MIQNFLLLFNLSISIQENQQNNDGEIFDVIFKHLNENKDEMIQWQKEELEEKYSLAMTCMKLDIEILAMKKGNNELDEKSNEEKEEFEVKF